MADNFEEQVHDAVTKPIREALELLKRAGALLGATALHVQAHDCPQHSVAAAFHLSGNIAELGSGQAVCTIEDEIVELDIFNKRKAG